MKYKKFLRRKFTMYFRYLKATKQTRRIKSILKAIYTANVKAVAAWKQRYLRLRRTKTFLSWRRSFVRRRIA